MDIGKGAKRVNAGVLCRDYLLLMHLIHHGLYIFWGLILITFMMGLTESFCTRFVAMNLAHVMN